MSRKIIERVWADETVKGASNRLTMRAIAQHCDDDGICQMSIERISNMVNASRTTIFKSIKRLKTIDAIDSISVSSPTLGTQPNVYIIKVGMSDEEYQAALNSEKVQTANQKLVPDKKTKQQKKTISSKKKQGYTYLIYSTSGHYKIGVSKNPQLRLLQLQTGVTLEPFELSIVATHFSDDCLEVESQLHQRFDKQRVRGEWFKLNDKQVSELLAEWEIWQELKGIIRWDTH